jgi:phage replication-related protein YjqB (UPF0714/DUF867 family)
MSPFRDNLARDGVCEVLDVRGPVGIMAFHGGALERVTDVIASETAHRTESSYYAVLHPDDSLHVPSKFVDPAHSAKLAAFVDHVDVAIAIHGYGPGPDHRFRVLLGGINRAFATHIGAHLAPALPKYEFITELAEIPRELAGQHPDNPVNRVREQGVQIEVPAALRWHYEHKQWSDTPGVGRAPHVDAFIAALCRAIDGWPGRQARNVTA